MKAVKDEGEADEWQWPDWQLDHEARWERAVDRRGPPDQLIKRGAWEDGRESGPVEGCTVDEVDCAAVQGDGEVGAAGAGAAAIADDPETGHPCGKAQAEREKSRSELESDAEHSKFNC